MNASLPISSTSLLECLNPYHRQCAYFMPVGGNRSLVISETVQRHCLEYQPGVHYVEVPPRKLVDAIRYYLHHAAEREQIIENAYQLVSRQMTMAHSVRTLMDLALT